MGNILLPPTPRRRSGRGPGIERDRGVDRGRKERKESERASEHRVLAGGSFQLHCQLRASGEGSKWAANGGPKLKVCFKEEGSGFENGFALAILTSSDVVASPTQLAAAQIWRQRRRSRCHFHLNGASEIKSDTTHVRIP